MDSDYKKGPLNEFTKIRDLKAIIRDLNITI